MSLAIEDNLKVMGKGPENKLEKEAPAIGNGA